MFITTSSIIVTVPASKIDSTLKDDLDKLIENNTYIGTTSERYIDYPPLLNYCYSTIDQKVELLEEIVPYIGRKHKSAFYSMLSKDCVYQSQNKKLIGKKTIKKYINSITGIFNFKVIFDVGTYYCGYINRNGFSDILIEISYCLRSSNERTNKYVTFDFDDEEIKTIHVYDTSEIVAKMLNDNDMMYVKSKKYNNYDKKIAWK